MYALPVDLLTRDSFSSLKVLILATLPLCLAARIIYSIFFHPLASVPGPKVAAITDLWKTYIAYNGRYMSALHEQHVKYGDVVRIGPNEVSVVAPKDVKTMYDHRAEYLKGPLYDTFAVGGPNAFTIRDPVVHGIFRSSVASAYSLKNIVSLEQFCDYATELLLQNLDSVSDNASIVDLSKLMDWYAYDAVSGIAFGKLFGLLEAGADEAGIMRRLTRLRRTVFAALTLSSFGWILPTKLGSLFASTFSRGNGPDFLIAYGAKIVMDRQRLREANRAVYEENKDMLYRMLESAHSATSELTNAQSQSILTNTLTIIFAGADTTKISMTAFLRYVYTHPPTLARLREEIDNAVVTGHLSFPTSHSQAARLDFLSACIKEAMRLHPAVGMPLQRVVPDGGRVVGGRYFPGGTLIGMSAYEIHRDVRAYGKDAGEWRPERWLEEDRNELEKVNLAFGQGSRICLGKHISMMEMCKLLPTIVYHYDIVVKNPEQPWKLFESWFVDQQEFFCSVTKRDVGSAIHHIA